MSDDLPYSDFRNHPVTLTLRDVAAGMPPREADLDRLKLPAEQRRKLAAAITTIATTKAAGENQVARTQADDAADQILTALPPELRDPSYLRPPEPDVYDPASLAAQVPRGW